MLCILCLSVSCRVILTYLCTLTAQPIASLILLIHSLGGSSIKEQRLPRWGIASINESLNVLNIHPLLDNNDMAQKHVS